MQLERRPHIGGSPRALAAIGAALVAAFVSGGAATADAAFPGQAGSFAFFFRNDIWVAGADGSNPRQLTTTPGIDRSPSWSADGTKIAFSSDRNFPSKIFVMNADGSDQRQVTFGSGRDRTNAWTANGRQVLYDREFVEIYVANADGSGGERKLTNGWGPSVSPYGDRVAFVAAGVGIETVRLDGTDLPPLTNTGQTDFSPDWSPGGSDLVFTRTLQDDRDVYRIHSNGVGLVRLTNTPGRSEVGPVWSPDGTRIAFVGCPNPPSSADCGIYVMNLDGTGETQVPGLAASFAEAPLDWQPLPPFPQGQAPAALRVRVAGRGGAGSVASAPAGIECPPACSAEFDRSSSVRLEARPSGGTSFLGWNGSCSGRGPTCSMTMDSDKHVTASFGPSTSRLTVLVRGPGRVVSRPAGISCPRRCTATFTRNARVLLRAVPVRGARFVGWRGACRGSKGCLVAMNGDRVVRARFRG